MRFLVDAQLSPALARLLCARGHEAEHVVDRQMQAASDSAIWDFALGTTPIMITKDADFVQRKTLAEIGPAVVWIRLPNTRRKELLVWFELTLPQILAALATGESMIETIPSSPAAPPA